MGIGKSIQRVDACAKVTGQAKYTQDLMTQQMMVAEEAGEERRCDPRHR